jgi:DNA-directed RNA polymerase specialized sigma24 family protein
MAWRRFENQQDRHEFPSGAVESRVDESDNQRSIRREVFIADDLEQPWDVHRAPSNEYEALMNCGVGQEPDESQEELEGKWAKFQVKLDTAGLTERERVVIDSMIFGGRSLSETADLLAISQGTNHPFTKTTIARIRDSGFAKLREALKEFA